MVRAVARDDLVPSRVPARELDRVLVRLRAAVREERHRQVAGRDLREQPRELGALLVRHHRPDRRQPVRLLLDRGDHLRVLVPERDVDELRREVEVAVAVEVPEVAALGARDRDRVDRRAHRPRVEDVLRVVRLHTAGVCDCHQRGNSMGIVAGGVPMTIAISRRLLSSICVGSPIVDLAVDVDLDRNRRLAVAADAVVRQPDGPLGEELAELVRRRCLRLGVQEAGRVMRVQRRDARLVALLRQACADDEAVRPRVGLHGRVVEVDPDPGRDEHRPAVDEHVEVRVHVVLEELGLLRDEARLARQPHRVLGRGPRRFRRPRGRDASVLGAVAAPS